MRVKKAVGEHNYNLGAVPGHVSGRRADIIPVGAVVDAEMDAHGWCRITYHVPGVDSYGNTVIYGDIGLVGDTYLEPLSV